jgi:hypothetical protein
VLVHACRRGCSGRLATIEDLDVDAALLVWSDTAVEKFVPTTTPASDGIPRT